MAWKKCRWTRKYNEGACATNKKGSWGLRACLVDTSTKNPSKPQEDSAFQNQTWSEPVINSWIRLTSTAGARNEVPMLRLLGSWLSNPSSYKDKRVKKHVASHKKTTSLYGTTVALVQLFQMTFGAAINHFPPVYPRAKKHCNETSAFCNRFTYWKWRYPVAIHGKSNLRSLQLTWTFFCGYLVLAHTHMKIRSF